MFSEGDASSSGPVHCLAVQQVTCCGLLSYRIQAGGGPSTSEQKWTRCNQLKELQTRFQLIISVEAIGESLAGQIVGFS